MFAIALQLLRLGVPVIMILERFHLRYDQKIIDNYGSIVSYLPRELRNRTLVVDTRESARPFKTVESDAWANLLQDIQASLCLIWNGGTEQHKNFLQAARERSCKVAFLEKGWLPQKGTVSLNYAGIGSEHSAAQSASPSLSNDAAAKVTQVLHRYEKRQITTGWDSILVPLQLEYDQNIVRDSPFKTMRDFLLFLDVWIPKEKQIVVRPHPLHQGTVSIPERFSLSNNASVKQDILGADLVVGINSTSLIEAIAHDVPVVAFGRGVFSASTAIVSLETDAQFPERFTVDPQARLELLGDLLLNYQVKELDLRQPRLFETHPMFSQLTLVTTTEIDSVSELAKRNGWLKQIDSNNPLLRMSFRAKVGLNRMLGKL